MGIKYAPYAGQILLCDFSGFILPEMQKTRPVIALTPRTLSQRTFTTTIVPLSTTVPYKLEQYHIPVHLPLGLPSHWATSCWAKCDMLYTVGFSRLGFMKCGKDAKGKRLYYTQLIDRTTLAALREAALHTLGYVPIRT